MLALARVVAFGILGFSPVEAAQARLMLSCKAEAQQSCDASGCAVQQPVTQAELGVDLGNAKPVFCYGTACWRTKWSRLNQSGAGRLVVILSGEARFGAKQQQLWLQAVVAVDSLRFRASVTDDAGPMQVLWGSCVCRDSASESAACAAAVLRRRLRLVAPPS